MQQKMKAKPWARLDNAAKIFPPTSSKRDSKVFRLACELTEQVDPEVLQVALDKTVEEFPYFRSVLRHGLFWYYLETSEFRPLVRPERKPPCSSIYDKNVKKLLFEVTYYQRRINLEVYHVLTDGTGGLLFLRFLVYHYLILKHADHFGENPPLMDADASMAQKQSDSFQKYYDRHLKQRQGKTPAAYKLKGAKIPENRLRIIEGVVSVQEVLTAARERGTTATVLLTALLLQALQEERSLRDKRNPAILIPVNLRKYFDSESSRNFFGVITVKHDFNKEKNSLEEIMASVKACFDRELTKEALEKRMNMMTSLEHNVFMRVVPLALKDVVMRAAGDLSERESTATLSNVGEITMPEELCGYIRLFDVFISTNKLQVCVNSFGDNMTLCFTSPFVSTDVQRRFFRSLSAMGIRPTIVSNQLDEE